MKKGREPGLKAILLPLSVPKFQKVRYPASIGKEL